MQRRTFIQLCSAALGAFTLPLGLGKMASRLPNPPRFTQKEIESVVRGFFTPELLRKNKFDWTAHFIKGLGLDSLDTVELVMHCEQQLHTMIPDVVAENIITPRQLADTLMTGLNNGIVLYEKPDFKGAFTILFTTKGVTGKVKLGNAKGYSSIYTVIAPGSLHKPKGYDITLNGQLLGSKNKVWEDAQFGKRVSASGGDLLMFEV